ncbi:E3 ubiquitin- ligase RNF31 isoform X1 [Pelobates cultripes]|uniref:RBR-type E3 ubiquitin transferase n=2 Tax=Pelobates cultripes TaxID=61616 RepID=A0AAD1S7Q8_PELCU|nr:E3 ubiquitin- ligase RNF31 isoform X1 [Pelobates cultripes]
MLEKEQRDALECDLIDHPDTVTCERLNEMLHVSLKERYRRLDVETLLRGGTQTPPLRSVITALNILEKYGRNLLSPNRPKFWRSVKFNNPVFKAQVDAVEGGRLVLSLYGYSCSLPDGLSFPESVKEPDIPTVAAVTADVIILHHELNLLISNSHPRQVDAAKELLNGGLRQPSLVPDSSVASQIPPSVPVSTGCCLCGVPTVSVWCSSCNDMLCTSCDHRVHTHPNRVHHQRSSCGTSGTQRSPGHVSVPVSASRPLWQCATCHNLNRGVSVLCVGCERPRGCASSPSSPSLGSSLKRDSWVCMACTLQNDSSAVLCAVCERPRLASRPSRDNQEASPISLIDCHESQMISQVGSGKGSIFPDCSIQKHMQCYDIGSHKISEKQATDLPMHIQNETGGSLESISPLKDDKGEDSHINVQGWQCSHCTFYNIKSGRVCEMCDRTSECAAVSEVQQTEDTQKLSCYQEEIRKKKLSEDGAKLVALIREGERSWVSPEEICSAVRYSGTEVPLRWLQTELPYVVEHVIDAASQRAGTEIGILTPDEARIAWISSGGEMEDAVTFCVAERRSKVEELRTLGFTDRDMVVAALFESAGDVGKALCILQRPLLEPFLIRMWEEPQPAINVFSADRQAVLRRLLAEHSLHSWGRAELALQLLQEGEGRYDLQDVVEAVKESQDRDFIKRMLTQECAVCAWEFPRNKMRSLTSCECCICPDCFRTHFTVAIKEKHIRDMVCPACEEPEISDEGELLHYFSTLDILLRDTLEVDAYNLFHKKLTERTLMKDPKFLWCTHCSFGFIYERDQLDVKCPQCECSFCRNCKRPWEEQHRSLSCEDFQNWKRENDAEYQAQGLAVYLQENGITCPHCKFSYALARGGCMHFICSQCRHQFCSGCYNTFHPKNKCTVRSCTVRMSLHAHHPRDCLFYLRDWEVTRLQRLLQMSQVQFNTDPPAGTQAGPGGGCRVMEQKENLEGLKDEACGKITAPGYAGLCESHYKEYLVSRINALCLDPCLLYDLGEVVNVCQRYLSAFPPKEGSEDDGGYRDRLVRLLMSEVPLNTSCQRNQRS